VAQGTSRLRLALTSAPRSLKVLSRLAAFVPIVGGLIEESLDA